MRSRLLAAVFLFSLTAAAQDLSVQQLRAFLQSAVKFKQTDKEVAGALAHAKLTEKLDDRTIEDLQSLATGPQTLAALRSLREQSQGLPAAAPLTSEVETKSMAPPSEAEQGATIADVREYALNYSKSLPDFICTQVTRRYITAASRPAGDDSAWLLQDTLTLRLSYFQQKEEYKLVLVNNSPANQDYLKLAGATSTGEFGSMLKDLFEPRTETRFSWDRWATVRGRLALAFQYRVAQDHSHWRLDYEGQRSVFPAYSGVVFVDKDTHQVLRVTFTAEDIPAGFSIEQAETKLDYDFQTISDHPFLLPLKAENRLKTDQTRTRNDVEFRLYRKFSTESEIKYWPPEAPIKQQAPPQ